MGVVEGRPATATCRSLPSQSSEIRRMRASMNPIARSLYATYVSSVPGTGHGANPSME